MGISYDDNDRDTCRTLPCSYPCGRTVTDSTHNFGRGKYKWMVRIDNCGLGSYSNCNSRNSCGNIIQENWIKQL